MAFLFVLFCFSAVPRDTPTPVSPPGGQLGAEVERRGRMERTYWYWPGKRSSIQASVLGTDAPARGSCLPFTTALIQNSVSCVKVSKTTASLFSLRSLFPSPSYYPLLDCVVTQVAGNPGAGKKNKKTSKSLSGHASLRPSPKEALRTSTTSPSRKSETETWPPDPDSIQIQARAERRGPAVCETRTRQPWKSGTLFSLRYDGYG